MRSTCPAPAAAFFVITSMLDTAAAISGQARGLLAHVGHGWIKAGVCRTKSQSSKLTMVYVLGAQQILVTIIRQLGEGHQ
jgi:hypothetical protein